MSNNSEPNDSLALGQDERILVKGPLTFDSVVPLNRLGKRMIKHSTVRPCVIDLSGVNRAGSAGVSLLLSWARYARSRDIEVSFCNLPSGLVGVAQVSGIDEILPIA